MPAPSSSPVTPPTRVPINRAQAEWFQPHLTEPALQWNEMTDPTSWPTIPGYDLVRELGRGGMGVVFLARDRELKRPVALKVLRDSCATRDESLQRFRAEAEAVAKLHHPNIVQIYEIGEHDGRPFLALEYVDGPTLFQHLGGKPLPPREAAELLEPLAHAVQHAHDHGILHRDLKPGNILLVSGGVVSCPNRTRLTTHHSPLTNPRSPTSASPSRWVRIAG